MIEGKFIFALVIVIIVLVAAAIWHKTGSTPKSSTGSARKPSKPTEQRKR